MSKTTIIYAHPYEKSFNHAILERVQALLDAKGQEYRLIDLHADGFNPSTRKRSWPCSARARRWIRWCCNTSRRSRTASA